MLQRLVLSQAERDAVRALLLEINAEPDQRRESVFLERAAVIAHALPERIRTALYEFKTREPAPALVITNSPVEAADIGPTPQRHIRPSEEPVLTVPQMMQGLYASHLGEPFGFETQHHGRVFNDLIPLREAPPNSSSGIGDIGLHTEDCFQPFCPDYLSLLCLRNEQRANTTLSSLWNTPIPDNVRDVLFDARFWLSGRNGSPIRQRGPILFGDPERPYVRFSGSLAHDMTDQQCVQAVRVLKALLNRNCERVVLEQGDCLFVDNYLALHGRAAYAGSFGDNGRWFSRLVLLRDIRTTRALRTAADDRVMRNGASAMV